MYLVYVYFLFYFNGTICRWNKFLVIIKKHKVLDIFQKLVNFLAFQNIQEVNIDNLIRKKSFKLTELLGLAFTTEKYIRNQFWKILLGLNMSGT